MSRTNASTLALCDVDVLGLLGADGIDIDLGENHKAVVDEQCVDGLRLIVDVQVDDNPVGVVDLDLV